jgi:hypothetical protein
MRAPLPTLRCIVRFVVSASKAVTALMAIEAVTISAVVFLINAPAASAGDTLPSGGTTWAGNGDCWQPQTPTMCRTVWAGRGSQIHMTIIDQMNDTGYHNSAGAACNNWNAASGPQWCSYTSSNPPTPDTWTYLKIDSFLGAINGYTWNCVNGACPTANSAGNILWSEIYVPPAPGNNQNLAHPCDGQVGNYSTAVFAHELGHAYGLAHHGAACTNVTVMTQGSKLTMPTFADIGPFPGCSSGPGTGGLRCIYQDT